MALNALNKLIKSGGGLLVGERQANNAAQNQGLTSTPTSPLGLSSLGVTPDAAKMAGTGQQKVAATKQAITPIQPTTTGLGPTKEDTARRKQAQQVQKLEQSGNSLDKRVDTLIASRLSQQTQQNTLPTMINSMVDASGLKDADKPLFQKFLSSKGVLSDDEYEKLAKSLGIIKEGETLQDAQGLKQKMIADYFNPKSGKLTTKVNSGVTVKDVKAAAGPTDWAQELGFDNEAALSSFLGITPEQLEGKTIKDLNDAIDSQVANVFSQTKAQEAILNDPAASQLEKEQARAALGELSYRGVTAGEQEASKGAQALRGAETISFEGKEYSIEELADNKVFQTAASNYYGKTEADRKALKEKASPTDKAFYQMLDANESVLKNIQTDVEAGLTAAEAGTKEAKALYDSMSSIVKNPEKLKQVFGITGPAKLGSKKQEITTPFGKMIQSLQSLVDKQDPTYGPRAAAQIAALGRFIDSAPAEYVELLKDKDIDWFKANNLWTESNNQAELEGKLNRWKAKRDDIKFLSGDGDINTLLPQNEMEDLVSSLASLGEDTELQQILDANKDGKLDASAEIKNRIKARYPDSNNPDTPTLSELLGQIRQTAEQKYPPYLRDKNIDIEEAQNILPPSFEELDKILKVASKTDVGIKEYIGRRMFAAIPQVQEINKMLENGPSMLNSFQDPADAEHYVTYLHDNLLNPVRNIAKTPLALQSLVNLERQVQSLIDQKDKRIRQINSDKETARIQEEVRVRKEAEETKRRQEEDDRWKAKPSEQIKDFGTRLAEGFKDPASVAPAAASGLSSTVDKGVNYLKKKVKIR
jgi:hypothetical protein